ncbi:hypothetical protein H0A36_09675 [Endozoicomonas sp. SM1973]|uniref:DUF2846 domain-containing protein n=1 Tax=Spartinivicinus marinus TaxID=2994442 RepID=A0A853HX11_9GAMM|nr:hypothetical protein [Spartinivicinus marinus]MCX4024693.1 hypothetical protein [Spartinivicinus marinus]NYZ66280.1 hypothetical protein [Spartinivicinus marinus]
MKHMRLLVILACTIFAGCASNPMLVSQQQTIKVVDSSLSQVVFLRSSFVGSAISASLYDVTNGEPEFIGIIANGTKIAYDTTPGPHTFMVVSEAADFLQAEILPGKTYYSLVTPRMGMWKARFSLWPIRNDSSSKFNTSMPEFKKWLDNTKLVENSDKSKAWYKKNANSVKSKQVEYWPVWKEKSAEDIEKRTLNPQDGI